MCICIFKGKNHQPDVELGFDPFVPINGKEGDKDYYERNIGDGKSFPGGPTCNFRGKDVPCFVRFFPSGSITAEILVEILKELDHLGIYDRSKGEIPFLILDGHGSRFDIEFLEYIDPKEHEWIVCIGVPYGTSLWQVGDSEQQNGKFNYEVRKCKKQLIKKRKENHLRPELFGSDLMLIIKSSWNISFANIIGNKKAISERGWETGFF